MERHLSCYFSNIRYIFSKLRIIHAEIEIAISLWSRYKIKKNCINDHINTSPSLYTNVIIECPLILIRKVLKLEKSESLIAITVKEGTLAMKKALRNTLSLRKVIIHFYFCDFGHCMGIDTKAP